MTVLRNYCARGGMEGKVFFSEEKKQEGFPTYQPSGNQWLGWGRAAPQTPAQIWTNPRRHALAVAAKFFHLMPRESSRRHKHLKNQRSFPLITQLTR
jgi:hypothetical protein